MFIDTLKILNINPRMKRRKIDINNKERQERLENNKSKRDYIQNYDNYAERELLKQIKYELEHLGGYEKILTSKKELNNSNLDT